MTGRKFAIGFLCGLPLSALCSPALAQESWEDSRIQRLGWPELQQFESDRNFRRYVRDVKRIERELADEWRQAQSAAENSTYIAQVEVGPVECIEPEDCLEDGVASIVVTGARVASSPQSSVSAVTSITNNQSAMRFGADGALGDFGNIAPRPVPEGAEDSVAQGYSCEVSCSDWYGNARPIFIEDKAFALLGTELVESRAGQDGMTVDRRLDLTVRP